MQFPQGAGCGPANPTLPQAAGLSTFILPRFSQDGAVSAVREAHSEGDECTSSIFPWGPATLQLADVPGEWRGARWTQASSPENSYLAGVGRRGQWVLSAVDLKDHRRHAAQVPAVDVKLDQKKVILDGRWI